MTEKDTHFAAALFWAVALAWGVTRGISAVGLAHGDRALLVGAIVGLLFLMVSGQETTQ